MVRVDIHKVLNIQYLGHTDTEKIFIVYLKLKLNWIILRNYFTLLPKVSLWSKAPVATEIIGLITHLMVAVFSFL